MSRGRDKWFTTRTAAAGLIPRPAVRRVRFDRRLGAGWRVTVMGENLRPLGAPGSVQVGGKTLRDVRFSGHDVTGSVRRLPASREVTIGLGVTWVEASPVRRSNR
jgi:hypothetical protein